MTRTSPDRPRQQMRSAFRAGPIWPCRTALLVLATTVGLAAAAVVIAIVVLQPSRGAPAYTPRATPATFATSPVATFATTGGLTLTPTAAFTITGGPHQG